MRKTKTKQTNQKTIRLNLLSDGCMCTSRGPSTGIKLPAKGGAVTASLNKTEFPYQSSDINCKYFSAFEECSWTPPSYTIRVCLSWLVLVLGILQTALSCPESMPCILSCVVFLILKVFLFLLPLWSPSISGPESDIKCPL